MVQRSSLPELRPDSPPLQEQLARSTPAVTGGRLGVYAAFGAAAGALTLPWLPDLLSSRVRGAMVHDIAARHCVSLTPEARQILAEPDTPGVRRSMAARAARFFGPRLAVRALRSIAPVGLIWSLAAALRTYVLGHLFDRYLERIRSEPAVPIDAQEAMRIRGAVDRAIARALRVESEPAHEPASIDDQREATTILIDGLLGRAAGIPERLAQRLDAAFDEALRLGEALEEQAPA